MTYCLAAKTITPADAGTLGLAPPGPCIEGNATNAENNTFAGAILRDVTLFTDAFDGQIVTENVPSNGADWSQLSSGGVLTISSPPGAGGDDELVSLPGSAFPDWVTHVMQRGTSLTEDNVFGALDDAMIDNQVNYCERCQVFWLHTVDSGGNPTCPAAWVGQAPTVNVNGTTMPMSCVFQGTRPAGTNPDPATQVCDPPCPMGQVFDPVKDQCVDSFHVG